MTCPICQTGIERFNEVFYHQPDNSNINDRTGVAIINELLDQQYAERLQREINAGDLRTSNSHIVNENAESIVYQNMDQSNNSTNNAGEAILVNELLDRQYAQELQDEINATDPSISSRQIVNDNAESVLDQVLNQYDLDNQQRRHQGRRPDNTENEGVQCCICMEGEVRIMCVPYATICACVGIVMSDILEKATRYAHNVELELRGLPRFSSSMGQYKCCISMVEEAKVVCVPCNHVL